MSKKENLEGSGQTPEPIAEKKVKTVTLDKDSSLMDKIMEQTRLQTDDEGYELAKIGVEAFMKEVMKPQYNEVRIDKRQVDAMIDELDRRLGLQLDEIVHQADFQALESSWSSLKFMVDRTDFRQNTKVQIINSSKEEIAEDFEDAADLTKSGLYQHVYTNEYGQYGGEPIGLLVGNYSFGPSSPDLGLLKSFAGLSSMSHAPFIAGADPKFFGIDQFREMDSIKDLSDIFEAPQYAKWRGFREQEDSRNVGLAMPRFMLRVPYGEENPVKSFNYEEQTQGDQKNYLWGNAAFALATRMTESFAKYRWCPNIIGPQSGGSVPELAYHIIEQNGRTLAIGPTETPLPDRREYELAEEGFIALTMRKNADNASFFSANSVQKAKLFGDTPEEKQAELNYRLGTQLPYLMIVTRLAHYIKVLQRENLGSWSTKADLSRELNRWIKQYIAAQPSPSPMVRSAKPLRSAEIDVTEIPGEDGWYQVDLRITPHIKYKGANFTLSLTGRLEVE